MHQNLLQDIVEFWKTKYNWKEREQFLNKFPQFTTSIQGLNIHFIHVKPAKVENVKVLPLLLLHGWPGSVREFYEILPILTTPVKGREFVFEVIAPSLPGYGFSEAPVRPGLGAAEAAIVFKNLMQRLGYEKYYLQGGDWGAVIIANMARLYPEKILGLHSNMCFVNTLLSNLKLFLASFYPSAIVDEKFQSRIYPLSTMFSNIIMESGYMHLQATKPDTVGNVTNNLMQIIFYSLIYLGVALTDSPVGLAAYILEKFTTWTNPQWKEKLNGGLTEKFTYTKLLDNVMIYWVTGSITTSMRIYSETFSKTQMSLNMDL